MSLATWIASLDVFRIVFASPPLSNPLPGFVKWVGMQDGHAVQFGWPYHSSSFHPGYLAPRVDRDSAGALSFLCAFV